MTALLSDGVSGSYCCHNPRTACIEIQALKSGAIYLCYVGKGEPEDSSICYVTSNLSEKNKISHCCPALTLS